MKNQVVTSQGQKTGLAQARGRFAPSPTGRMHLGNVWVALLSQLAIHSLGGQQILRIEDLDAQRSTDEYTLQLVDDLRWLGLPADLGMPPDPLIRQSERQTVYQEIFEQLVRDQLVYPCFCRRADLLAASAPHAEDGHRVYAGTCRPAQLAAEPLADRRLPAWRLAVTSENMGFVDLVAGQQVLNMATEWGDFVIRRADGGFAYQLACAVDDALMGVDLVVRGCDLLRSTFPQIYIFRLIDRPAPQYVHVPLLVDPQGVRLSKRQQSLDIGALQAAGCSAEQLLGYLAWLAGLIDKPESASVSELLCEFDLAKMKDRATVTVDPAELYRLL